ncbi:bile acid:sodium symporter family protein [Thalassoroseus pseudoceratinae]|uniref:bile acid:sodium symporter family protein n=1 Tax=Thalassoroseus pseudoceratinae TaxID=2713176 RepID=UPI0014206051|nr:bile acid:sodium symporter family protein [Thalassoroseus pseudoceratinae]
MFQRFLLGWLILLSLLAYSWPSWNPELDPFAISKPYLGWIITVTMFLIGGLLPRDEIRQVLKSWPTVLGGTLVQYATMPLAAYTVARLAGLEGEWLLGLVLVGSVPGAMASNVLTLAARGNVSYSVSLTTTATLLSPIFVPLILFLTLRQSLANPAAIAQKAFLDLLLQVAIPVLSGYFLARSSRRAESVLQRIGPTVANLTILWVIAVVVNANHERLANLQLDLLAMLLVINGIGYLAGWFGGGAMRISHAKRRALTLEVGMQNAGLGATLASQLFPDQPTVALPAALYTFGCMLTGTMLAQWWAMRVGSEEAESPAAEGQLAGTSETAT